MKNLLQQIVTGHSLSAAQTAQMVEAIMAGTLPPVVIGAFLMGLKQRGETIAEIFGAATALRAHMVTIPSPAATIDVCGTGGDGLGGRNVSTAVALVVAACGVPVAKHGNRSASSRSSSVAVLESLGVRVDLPMAAATQALVEFGLTFLPANHYHPAMAALAPLRRELGIATLFNLLGPLCNPAGVRRQLLGVYAPNLTEPLAHVLAALGSDRAWVVHGAGGMDELSLAGPSQVSALQDGTVRTFTLQPQDAGLPEAPVAALAGGDAQDNAEALQALLQGAPGPYRDTVLYNAAAALVIAQATPDLISGVRLAAEALDSGAAQGLLARWVAFSQAMEQPL